MTEHVTLAQVIDRVFPPIGAEGYFSTLPKELRAELAKFESSSNCEIVVELFDKKEITYTLVIIDKQLRSTICIQPTEICFDAFHGKAAVLQFFLYISELNRIRPNDWPSPIKVLYINHGSYEPLLFRTGMNYRAVAELTPNLGLTLDHGIYSKFDISRDLIIALYEIAGNKIISNN